MTSLIRSRWAAIGAAVAVTLGAGGLITANAASDPSVFIAINPTRVLDTRIDVGLTDPLINGTARNLDVTGTVPIVLAGDVKSTGAPVPDGATAIVANVTGISPSTVGFLSIRPGTATGVPSTSSLNFSEPGVIVPNSVTVELPTTGGSAGNVNLYYRGTAPGAAVDVLIDIVGYYIPGGAGTPGPKGDTGAMGATGAKGTTGARGPSGLSFVTSHTSAVSTALTGILDEPANYTLERALTAGRYFVSGDLTLRNADAATRGDVFCQFFVNDVIVGVASQISVVATGGFGNIAISQTFEIASDTAPIGLGIRCRENGGSTAVSYYWLNMTLFKVS